MIKEFVEVCDELYFLMENGNYIVITNDGISSHLNKSSYLMALKDGDIGHYFNYLPKNNNKYFLEVLNSNNIESYVIELLNEKLIGWNERRGVK